MRYFPSALLIHPGLSSISLDVTPSCDALIAQNPIFEPIRISPIVDDISVLTRQQATYLNVDLIPNAIMYLQNAVRVRRARKPLVVELERLGQEDITLENTDLAIILNAMSCGPLEGESTFMMGAPIQWDVCGRPTAGIISVCQEHMESSMRSDAGRSELTSGVLHELIHILGFHAASFERWRDRDTMEPIVPDMEANSVWYHCSVDEESGEVQIQWNVGKDFSESDMYLHTFLPGIVEAIDARGLKAEDCRCPTDLSRTYDSSDIEHCMSFPEHCALAIITPTVVERTREYYACPAARGMELENTVLGECGALFNDHWKARTVRGELMNSREHYPFAFVSPMTFAALEDSGWYRMDYTQLNTMLPGATWGFHAGCDFLAGACMHVPSGTLLDAQKFCLPQQDRQQKCSQDTLAIEVCDAGTKYGVWGYFFDMPHADLEVYKYGESSVRSAMRYFDFCSTFVFNNRVCSTESNPNRRCLMSPQAPECVDTRCSADRLSYAIIGFGSEPITCTRAGQIVTQHSIGRSFTCADPSIVCAKWNYNHLLPMAGVNGRHTTD
jgi:hypothetical protein